MDAFVPAVAWPQLISLHRLGLALGMGLFVGLEREWRGKEAGLRTFGFVALLGGIGGMLGENYALVCLALLGILVIILNWHSLKANHKAELTTSAALLVVGATGVLYGLGHTITPTAVGVVTAGLLAWKEHLAVFSHKLTATELRAEILLAILAFVVYPLLPASAIDQWGLIVPRTAWATVILVAAIGFVNYVLWKIYGEEGIELTGFLGGLVNSTVAVTELANRVRETHGRLADVAYRGVLLATAAMSIRNAVILGVLAFAALRASIVPLLLILVPCALFVLVSKRRSQASRAEVATLPLQTPFSLKSALKFGFIFLVLEVAGTFAHNALGHFGFYAVSVVGGLVSSASAVASAATLVSHGQISPAVGGLGSVLASLASASVNIVLVSRFSGSNGLTWRLTKTLAVALLLALGAAVAQDLFFPMLGL